ncbi:Transcriptional repressor OPI1 [Hypsizygus marmoreus]|uniref:Transcriptional repressor OPI1 n=1 Tax=Hypsizygus marmoreus TaxID=39966 RepID=A0A369J3K0_HYPMA|nr:Transcriptional repressor OPI1 [Hypsizygus marmoreus]
MDNVVPDLQDQDESVRIAVRALGDMRNSAQAARADLVASTSDTNSPFVSRVSHLPIVNSALRVYEHGKASSRVVKYGAEMVESSVKTISRPVIDRLPVNVNQLDEFACRQLDRLDRYRRPSSDDSTNIISPPTSPVPSSSTQRAPTSPSSTSSSGTHDLDRPKVRLKSKTLDGSVEDIIADSEGGDDLGLGKGWRSKGKGAVPSWLQANSPFVGPPPPPPDLTSTTPTQPQSEERQVARRSRWQAVLLEAGGLSAALSEESMRRLKYCLQWLQYATAHIDAQILILRDFTASLQPLSSNSQTRNGHPPISQAHLRTLTTVRRDIVHTIRQVVDVVSRYAGGALPEPARGRVRGFILQLPQRWARKAGPTPGSSSTHEDGERERDREREHEREMERETVAAAAAGGRPVRRGHRRAAGRERGAGGGAGSATSSRATSPVMRHARHHEDSGESVSAGTATAAAQRILTLATESLDMMRGVTGVVKDSLDRADAWVGRFRTVGIQRGATRESGDETSPSTPHGNQNPEGLEQELEFAHVTMHRRVETSGSQFDDDGMHSPYSGASSYSSYAGGSSFPSTPGAGTYTPAYAYAAGQYAAASGMYAGSAPSPDAVHLGLGSMTLSSSTFSTPRSMAGALPDEGEDGEDSMLGQETLGPGKSRPGGVEEVKIVGMDVELGESGEQEDGKGSGKMDVDA